MRNGFSPHGEICWDSLLVSVSDIWIRKLRKTYG